MRSSCVPADKALQVNAFSIFYFIPTPYPRSAIRRENIAKLAIICEKQTKKSVFLEISVFVMLSESKGGTSGDVNKEVAITPNVAERKGRALHLGSLHKQHTGFIYVRYSQAALPLTLLLTSMKVFKGQSQAEARCSSCCDKSKSFFQGAMYRAGHQTSASIIPFLISVRAGECRPQRRWWPGRSYTHGCRHATRCAGYRRP